MAKYIARILDTSNNEVYPQVMAGGVLGLEDYALKKDVAVKDTGLIGTGITFKNGGYDWGIKQGDGSQYSSYRVVTVGGTDIIFLSLDVGFSKDLTQSNSIIDIGKLPKIASFDGTNNYIPGTPVGMQFRVLNDSFGIKSPNGVIKANTRMALRTLFIKSHSK